MDTSPCESLKDISLRILPDMIWSGAGIFIALGVELVETGVERSLSSEGSDVGCKSSK